MILLSPEMDVIKFNECAQPVLERMRIAVTYKYFGIIIFRYHLCTDEGFVKQFVNQVTFWPGVPQNPHAICIDDMVPQPVETSDVLKKVPWKQYLLCHDIKEKLYINNN